MYVCMYVLECMYV